MTHTRGRKALGGSGKRPTDVSLAEELVAEAKALGVNVSAACESGLEAEVVRRRRQRWLDENASAIEAYNARVERDGLVLQRYRRF